MKYLQACLSAREDRESSFHRCGGHVRMVQACLCAVKTWYRSFNHRGAAVKHVQACLSAREDRESCFHHYRGSVRLLQACSCARKN